MLRDKADSAVLSNAGIRMAKQLSDHPITAQEMEEYARGAGDFAFELQTLNELHKRGIRARHGGSYDDPQTGKPREFDIVATMRGTKELHLAIECKNLRHNYPLLVSCLPRKADEAWHEVVIYGPQNETRSTEQ